MIKNIFTFVFIWNQERGWREKDLTEKWWRGRQKKKVINERKVNYLFWKSMEYFRIKVVKLFQNFEKKIKTMILSINNIIYRIFLFLIEVDLEF